MAKRGLPKLNRVAFFRLKQEDLISTLAEAIVDFAGRRQAKVSRAHAAIVAWSRLAADVANGGFAQFFYNNRGDGGMKEAGELLSALGEGKLVQILRQATAVYRKNKRKFATAKPWEGLFGSIKEFDKLDDAFMNQLLKGTRALEKWIRAHIRELATDEEGGPIDAAFTGVVETRQANGLVGEYLEVKKGKPSGAYREFFDDGSVRRVVFYRNGEVSGDFWPNGQLKKKESRKGNVTVIEWYYPSGKLQKRYVKDKSGYAVEPVRLFYENGQLAEEVNTVKGNKKGAWVRFFEDGSPRLQAEYGKNEELIVRNAWDDSRRQVVKNGAGTYTEDDRSIDCSYSLFFESGWVRVQELRNGRPHGKVVTYCDGVMWSVNEFRNGVREGESKTYWDNGRIRSIEQYRKGKLHGPRQEFPKFDNPEPAVILEVEANAKLYTGWGHMQVDEYPRVLNMDEVRRQLKVPAFLQEVHERNLAGALESDYEDDDTFKDGIAYFLQVDEEGQVTEASPSGSAAYSGGEWGTYLELLKQLRFSPGRIRGRAVPCRVLATVDHTFVEGKPQKK